MNAPQSPRWSWTEVYAPETRLRVGPLLDETKLKEIAEATGLAIKPGTDLRGLCYDLGRCAIYLHVLKRFRERDQEKTLEAKIARRSLRGVIALPSSLVQQETKQYLAEVLKKLEEKQVVERSRNQQDKNEDQEKKVTVSDMQWLVGKYLAEIFERIFARRATFAYNGTTQEPDAPFVSFADSVLKANGITDYELSSFKTALDRVRKAGTRSMSAWSKAESAI
jgi:hypothetical protein